ncbi:MAG: TonB-dependent receptor [Ferruginibacter sp.]
MKILNVVFFMFCILQGLCQVAGTLATVNGRPIVFANVSVLNSSDTLTVSAGLTDKEGNYQLKNIAPGSYILQLSITGYITWHSPVFEITASQKDKNFGIIVMQEHTTELEGVVLRAEKPLYQQQPGGIIVNVENSLLTKGSSALEVLERSPGVVVDHRNNSIALNGKAGVMVMLNGKLMYMPMEQVVSLLNSMSADDIASIELLTTPPANYDAQGGAGLINIVLKKNKKQGTSGAVSMTGGYGKGEKAMANINLNRNTRNINLSGSYTFFRNKTYSEMYITSAQYMPFMGGPVEVVFIDTTNVLRNNHDATLGIDIKLNPRVTVGGHIAFNSSSASSVNSVNAGYNVLPDSLLIFTGANKGINKWNNVVNSVYFDKSIREGEKISLDVDYLYFGNDASSKTQSSFIDKHGLQAGSSSNLFSSRQRGFANTTIRVGVVKMDYTKQLNKKVKLEAGIKSTYTQSSSLSGILSLIDSAWVSSDQTTNNIVMKEAIGATYASFNWQVSQSANLVAGLRYEYSTTNMNDPKTGIKIINRKLGSVFPNIFFAKKLTDKSELQISYTKRISRPSYNDLASYVGYSDPTAVYTGNPFLKPTITNNLKFGYNYRGYSFSLLFSRDKDAITRYQLSQSPAADILYISPQNLARQNNITLQANIPVKLNNWWSMNYGFVGGLRQLKGAYTLHPYEKNYVGYSLNFSQLFRLPADFSAEFSGWYGSYAYNGTVKSDGYGMLNAGIKKDLKNNKGTFQLSVSDLLRTERINVYYGSVTEEAFAIRNHVSIKTESAKSPIIRLTYSRSFGSGSSKDRGKEVSGSRDERERVRKD